MQPSSYPLCTLMMLHGSVRACPSTYRVEAGNNTPWTGHHIVKSNLSVRLGHYLVPKSHASSDVFCSSLQKKKYNIQILKQKTDNIPWLLVVGSGSGPLLQSHKTELELRVSGGTGGTARQVVAASLLYLMMGGGWRGGAEPGGDLCPL